MNVTELIDSLERFRNLIPHVVAEVSPNDARWKPADGGWSIVEIICHLADEEEFDFPARVRSTLEDPDKPWAPIDPEGWAVSHKYNEQELAAAVGRFVRLRAASVDWLRALKHPDWTRTHEHPKFGPFQAGDLFAAWVAHDSLHLRQIAKRFFQLAQQNAGGFSTRYAGDWKA